MNLKLARFTIQRNENMHGVKISTCYRLLNRKKPTYMYLHFPFYQKIINISKIFKYNKSILNFMTFRNNFNGNIDNFYQFCKNPS